MVKRMPLQNMYATNTSEMAHQMAETALSELEPRTVIHSYMNIRAVRVASNVYSIGTICGYLLNTPFVVGMPKNGGRSVHSTHTLGTLYLLLLLYALPYKIFARARSFVYSLWPVLQKINTRKYFIGR